MNTSVLSTTSTLLPPLPTSLPYPDHRTFGYVFGSVAVITIAAIALAMVLMLLRKSRNNLLRQHLVPLYSFEGTDDDQEGWEAELLDDNSERHSLKRGYRSMEFPSSHNTAGFS